MSILRSVTVSPSSSTRNFVTPCVAGWDGPMLRTIRFVGSGARSSSCAALAGVPVPFLGLAMDRSPPERALVARGGAGPAEDVVDRALLDARLPAAERVVLAERVPLELVVHEQPAQVGVARHPDAVHVEAVALVPVRAAPHRRDRGELLALG